MSYHDSDSVAIDSNTAKQYLNSLYGTQVRMNKQYISVIVDGNPTVIFKRNIIAVAKGKGMTYITCIGDILFSTKEDYASVVKKIIG